MINPNKLYKASQTGVITKIETLHPYIDQFIVEYRGSGQYVGYASDIKNFKRFKIGDRVKCKMQFSITQDKFLIKNLRRVLK